MNPIEAAVMPLKEQAIERAEYEAHKIIDRVKEKLKEAGGDLNVAAPYPSNNLSQIGFMMQLNTYNMYRGLTKTREGSAARGMNDPHYADMDIRKMFEFVRVAKEDAADQYDAFVAKLVAKIGKVKSAELSGNHVWDYSILKVVLQNKEIQNWKTQQIVNVSKLGKVFNQWPSRQIKKEKTK